MSFLCGRNRWHCEFGSKLIKQMGFTFNIEHERETRVLRRQLAKGLSARKLGTIDDPTHLNSWSASADFAEPNPAATTCAPNVSASGLPPICVCASSRSLLAACTSPRRRRATPRAVRRRGEVSDGFASCSVK